MFRGMPYGRQEFEAVDVSSWQFSFKMLELSRIVKADQVASRRVAKRELPR